VLRIHPPHPGLRPGLKNAEYKAGRSPDAEEDEEEEDDRRSGGGDDEESPPAHRKCGVLEYLNINNDN
jgi:hypothetical protein